MTVFVRGDVLYSPHDPHEAMLAREMQRRALEVAPSVYVCAVLDENLDDIAVPGIAGEVEGGELVFVGLVGISSALNV